MEPWSLARKSVEYVTRNLRYLADDPRFFSMKYAARFEVVRTLASRAAPDAEEELRSTESHVLRPPWDLPRVLATLQAEGYYVGLTLRSEVLESVLGRAYAETCYANRDPDRPMSANRPELALVGGRSPSVASYLDQQEDWPEFRILRDDPALRAIARAYLGGEPVYLRSELTWSFPQPAPSRAERLAHAQVFHCDINDYRTLKFFFYLTPVGPGSGPHAYLKKSPTRRTLLHQLLGHHCASIPEDRLLARYAANEVVTICGPAGTGFAGDPYYFHRGTSPTSEARLMLQIEFGMHRYRTWYTG